MKVHYVIAIAGVLVALVVTHGLERGIAAYIFQAECGSIGELYFFYADWCPHCQSVKPYVEEAAKKVSIKFCNVDKLSTECEEIAKKAFV